MLLILLARDSPDWVVIPGKLDGGGRGIRTLDLLLMRQPSYRCSTPQSCTAQIVAVNRPDPEQPVAVILIVTMSAVPPSTVAFELRTTIACGFGKFNSIRERISEILRETTLPTA